MSQNFDVCIRGSGIVGSTLALLLAQQRLRVALVSPANQPVAPGPDGHADVRAYALNSASRQLLTSLRVWPEPESSEAIAAPSAGTPVTRMVVHGDQGGELVFNAADVDTDALNWIVDAPALERRLAEALRYQGQVERFSADRALPEARLTIVCEGKRSATRAEWGLDYRVNAYPHHALAARLGVGDWVPNEEQDGRVMIDISAGRSASPSRSVPRARAEAIRRRGNMVICHQCVAKTTSRTG